MIKKWYADHARHIARFYSRYPTATDFKTSAEKRDWLLCERVMNAYEEKDMLMSYYASDLPVKACAREHKISESRAWKVIADFEKTLAFESGWIGEVKG